METAAGKQAMRILFGIPGDKLIDRGCESNYLWGNIVDQCSSINTRIIQVIEKCHRGPAEFADLLEVGSPFFYQFKGVRLEHLERLNVNMAVSDHPSSF
jgi:hypothetical protein